MDQKHKVVPLRVHGRVIRFLEHYDTAAHVWWGEALNEPGLVIGLRSGQPRLDLRKEASEVAASFVRLRPNRRPLRQYLRRGRRV